MIDSIHCLEDLHNHTNFSDGLHTPEEKIETAIKFGFNAIGITDHYNTRKCPSIAPKRLNEYIDCINGLKAVYGGRIKILCGLEMHVIRFPEVFMNFDFDATARLDYVLLEYIEHLPKDADIELLETFLGKIRCRIGLAHTPAATSELSHGAFSPFGNFIDFMLKHNIFWELNHGLRNADFLSAYLNYEKHPEIINFYQLLSANAIEVSTGSDTHKLSHYVEDAKRIERANAIIDKFGLKKIKF